LGRADNGLHVAAASGNQDDDIFHGAHFTVPTCLPYPNEIKKPACGRLSDDYKPICRYWKE
jgi:hypothetical protein